MKIISLLSVLAVVFLAGCGPKGATFEEQRSMIHDMEEATLARFRNEVNGGRDILNNAAGYGAFSNVNVNIIFASVGGGYGVITDNSTGEKTYMRMGTGGLGLGAGVKDFRAVIVFHDRDTMNKFVRDGWQFGASADAAARTPEHGGSLEAAGAVNKGMSLYEFTETGIALQATLSGTKYWQDRNLNSPVIVD